MLNESILSNQATFVACRNNFWSPIINLVLKIFIKIWNLLIAMNEVLEHIKSCENGLTEDLICFKFPTMKKIELAGILNNLLHQNLIEVFKDSDNIYYKSVHNKSSDYENLIINLIQSSGSTGLWLKDIKSKTNIPHAMVLKILKGLEDSCQIKSIKSVKNNRKTYVLFDVKPSEDISGGVWFNHNDVDTIFVNKLMDIICKFVYRPEESYSLNKIDNLVKMANLRDFIVNSGISEVELSVNDLNTLVDCLCYDGKIEKIEFENTFALRVIHQSNE